MSKSNYKLATFSVGGKNFKMEIDTSAKINYKIAALALAHEGYAYLLRSGLSSGGVCIEHDQNFIYIEEVLPNGTTLPAAVNTFSFSSWEDALNIYLTYVKPEYRHFGICTLIWKTLVDMAKEKGLHHIYSATHVNNKVMQTIMQKRGMKPSIIQHEYKLVYDDIPNITPETFEKSKTLISDLVIGQVVKVRTDNGFTKGFVVSPLPTEDDPQVMIVLEGGSSGKYPIYNVMLGDESAE